MLITLTAGVVFSGIAWEFSSDAPDLVIALGVWLVLIVLTWLWLRRDDHRQSAALRAAPIALAFAPTIVALGPMIAFPLPASLALPLLITGAFGSPEERLWSLVVQITLAAASLAVVWFVSFLTIRRRKRL